MSLAKTLTPKDTEEVKPNLFVQTKYKNITDDKHNITGRKPVGYRVINPVAWDGKLRLKEQLKTILSLRFLFTLAIIIFLVWAYQHDTKALQEFYNEVRGSPVAYCEKVAKAMEDAECTDWARQNNLCQEPGDIIFIPDE